MNLKYLKYCYLFVFLFFPYGCKSNKADNIIRKKISTHFSSNNDLLFSLNFEDMLAIKENLESPLYAASYLQLLKRADKALKEGPFSVVQKTQIPPSGDKHDYISIGPYWWPDPEKSDGLPWIRRDGQVNPLTRKENTDYQTKTEMFNNTFTLSLAYFFSNNREYSLKALELLKVWFLDEKTKMNPNLNFAQGIPGINSGRGIGIIEFSGINNIISSIEILEINHFMDNKTSSGLRKWFDDYLYWLQTSENGVFERNTKNNHGTWYDVQISSILVFLGRNDEARQVIEEAKNKRILEQIKPDGKQPHELVRTKSLSYSTMNLNGFTQLAYLAEKLGVNLWKYKSEKGAGIANAFEFLKPYAKGEKVWEYEQIQSLSGTNESLKQLFAKAGSLFKIKEYCEIGTFNTNKTSSLLYPCQ